MDMPVPAKTEEGQGRLLVFFGMIATGKSTLAAAWAEARGCVYYNSDRVRKEMAGIQPVARQRESMDQGIYSSKSSRRTYDRLLDLASTHFAADPQACVVLDGSYQSLAERDLLRARLERPGRQLLFVHCVCAEEVMRQRMDQRAQDPSAISDGRWEIYLRQKVRFQAPDELLPGQLLTIDTNRPLAQLVSGLARQMAAEVG